MKNPIMALIAFLFLFSTSNAHAVTALIEQVNIARADDLVGKDFIVDGRNLMAIKNFDAGVADSEVSDYERTNCYYVMTPVEDFTRAKNANDAFAVDPNVNATWRVEEFVESKKLVGQLGSVHPECNDIPDKIRGDCRYQTSLGKVYFTPEKLKIAQTDSKGAILTKLVNNQPVNVELSIYGNSRSSALTCFSSRNFAYLKKNDAGQTHAVQLTFDFRN